ncbi:MAG: hypothetical protein IKS76_02530 [Paludibacteraceae bacterium]|nr:hypothetical protein [Paludibacteraceae bacterium]
MRHLIDQFFRAGIKLAMLTGVTFTMTACYGVVPNQYSDDEAYQADTQRVEEVLAPDAEVLAE